MSKQKSKKLTFWSKYKIQPFLAIDIDFFIVIDHIPP